MLINKQLIIYVILRDILEVIIFIHHIFSFGPQEMVWISCTPQWKPTLFRFGLNVDPNHKRWYPSLYSSLTCVAHTRLIIALIRYPFEMKLLLLLRATLHIIKRDGRARNRRSAGSSNHTLYTYAQTPSFLLHIWTKSTRGNLPNANFPFVQRIGCKKKTHTHT